MKRKSENFKIWYGTNTSQNGTNIGSERILERNEYQNETNIWPVWILERNEYQNDVGSERTERSHDEEFTQPTYGSAGSGGNNNNDDEWLQQ